MLQAPCYCEHCPAKAASEHPEYLQTLLIWSKHFRLNTPQDPDRVQTAATSQHAVMWPLRNTLIFYDLTWSDLETVLLCQDTL